MLKVKICCELQARMVSEDQINAYQSGAHVTDHGHGSARPSDLGKLTPNSDYAVYGMTAVLLVAIFLIDISISLGVATGVPYVLTVWVVSRARNRTAILLTALVACALTTLGYMLSPAHGTPWQVIANRALALATIWLMVVVVLEFHHAHASQIAKAERELARLVEHSGDSIINIDVNWIVTAWNPASARIFGYSAEEMIGNNIDRLFVDGRHEGLKDVMPSLLAGDTVQNFQAVRRHKDGHSVEVELTLSPLRGESGELMGILGIGRDVTERNKTMREAERLRNELSTKNETLLRSNEDLDQFVSISSHDLRAPMRGIRALVDFIVKDDGNKISDESLELFEALDDRVTRLQAILDGLLQYGRAGREQAEVTFVDTAELCASILLMANLPEDFEIEIAPDLPELRTSRVALETVLRNLISNAVNHHDSDKGAVRITGQDLGDEVQFTVADDGPGIPPEFHERVFEAFRTLNPKAESSNTGLGLPIAQRMVEAAGGQIWVESSGNQRGTELHFTWNKTWPEAPADDAAGIRSSPAA